MALLIDIEGIDGSGKGTQSGLLHERLTAAGCRAQILSFPRYEATLFGRAVGEFLNGQYGGLNDVHPFLVSLLFAGDRLESRALLLESLHSHDVVILDRYVPSNIAHQASKRTGAERGELRRRIAQIEYEIYALPRPDLVLLLDLPVTIARTLVARKAARSYTDSQADIQEADSTYQQQVREVYLELAQTEREWHQIACCDGDQLRTTNAIADDIWSIVAPRLPAPLDQSTSTH